MAALTAIDFFENRAVLLSTLLADDVFGADADDVLGSSFAATVGRADDSSFPAQLFALCLLAPIAVGAEHFPLTHNGLFPYSGDQMRRIRRTLAGDKRLVAVCSDDPRATAVSSRASCLRRARARERARPPERPRL